LLFVILIEVISDNVNTHYYIPPSEKWLAALEIEKDMIPSDIMHERSEFEVGYDE